MILLIILCVFACVFFSGCAAKDYTIKFDKNMTLDYKSKDTPLSLIKKIGNKKITSKDIKDGRIKVDNLIVTCDEIDTSKKGQFEIKYYTNDVDHKEIRKSVKVSDISKPTISFSEDQITLLVSQIPSFNILDYIDVSDNDDQEPVIKMNLDHQMNLAGEYTVTVSAKDSTGNESVKELKIVVSADPEPVVEQPPVDQNNQGGSNSVDTSKKDDKKTADKNDSSNSNQSKPNEDKPVESKPDSNKTNQSSKIPSQFNKFFVGDTIPVYEEAYAYANRIFASGQVNGYSVEPTGTGYQVIFN